MKENRKFNYELMFLLRQSASADLGASVEHIRDLLAKAEGELIALKKWDERRLAFEIKKQKRGVYILAYATLPTANIASLERSLNLSETVLRWIIVRVDQLSIEEMQAVDAQQELSDEIKLRADRAREKVEKEDKPSAPLEASEATASTEA